VRGWWRGRWRQAEESRQALVGLDAAEARTLTDGPLWLTYNCDAVGRVYPIQRLNYRREDHVRALFKFANGVQLGPEGLEWLEIH
jgi:DNA-directed RNA polymerase